MPTFEEIAGGSTARKKKRTFEDIASGKGLTFEEIAGGDLETPSNPQPADAKPVILPQPNAFMQNLTENAVGFEREMQREVDAQERPQIEAMHAKAEQEQLGQEAILGTGRLIPYARHFMPMSAQEEAPNPTYGVNPILRMAQELPGGIGEVVLGAKAGGLPGVAAAGAVQSMLARGRENRIGDYRQTGEDPGAIASLASTAKEPGAWVESSVNAALNAATMGAAGAATKGLANRFLTKPIVNAATDQAAIDAVPNSANRFMAANIAAQAGIDMTDAVARSTTAHLSRGEEMSPDTMGRIARDIPFYLVPSVAMSGISGVGVVGKTQRTALQQRGQKKSPPPEPPTPAADSIIPNPPSPADGVPIPMVQKGLIARTAEPMERGEVAVTREPRPDEPFAPRPPYPVENFIPMARAAEPSPVEPGLIAKTGRLVERGPIATTAEPINALQQEPGPVVMEAPLAPPRTTPEISPVEPPRPPTAQEPVPTAKVPQAADMGGSAPVVDGVPAVRTKTPPSLTPDGKLAPDVAADIEAQVQAYRDIQAANPRPVQPEVVMPQENAPDLFAASRDKILANPPEPIPTTPKEAPPNGKVQGQEAPAVAATRKALPKTGAFKRIQSELGDDIHALMAQNNIEMTPDGRLFWKDERGGAGRVSMKKQDFVDWVLGKDPADDPATYSKDPAWSSIVSRARIAATGSDSPIPTVPPVAPGKKRVYVGLGEYAEIDNPSAVAPEAQPPAAPLPMAKPKAGKPYYMGLTPDAEGVVGSPKVAFSKGQQAYLIPKLAEAEALLSQSKAPGSVTIKVPDDGEVTVRTPQQARNLASANLEKPVGEFGRKIAAQKAEVDRYAETFIRTGKAPNDADLVALDIDLGRFLKKVDKRVAELKGEPAPIPMRGKFGKKTGGMARNPLGGLAETAINTLKTSHDQKMREWAEGVLAEARRMPTSKKPSKVFAKAGEDVAARLAGKSPDVAVKRLVSEQVTDAEGNIIPWDSERIGGLNPELTGMSKENYALATDQYLHDPEYKAKVDARRNVGHTWRQAEAEASGVPFDEMMHWDPTKKLLQDFEVKAVENTLAGVSKDVDASRAARIASDTPETRAAEREAMRSFGHLMELSRAVGTRTAQALNIRKAGRIAYEMNPQTGGKKAITPLDAVIWERVRQIAGKDVPVDEMVDIVSKIVESGEPEGAYRALRAFQRQKRTFGKSLNQYWMANVLSGYNTQVVNTVNTAFHSLLMEPFADSLAVGLSKVIGKEKRSFSDAYRGMRAQYATGAARGFAKAGELLRRGYTKDMMEAFELPASAEFRGGLLNPFNVPGRLLSASDTIFRTMAFEGKMAELSAAQARKDGVAQGLKGRALEDFVEKRFSDVRDEASSDMIDAAMKHAKEMTYQTDYKDTALGKPVRDFQQVAQGLTIPKTDIAPLVMVMPFVKTLYNIMRRSAHYSPIGLGRLMNKEKYDSSRVWAEAAIGGIAMYLGYMAQKDGKYTGSVPPDQGERQDFFEAKKRPFSLEVPGGNWATKYFGPLQPVINAGAQIRKIVEDSGLPEAERKPEKHFFDIIKSVTEQSFMTGPNTLAGALTGNAETAAAKTSQLATNIVGGFVPMSSLLRQANRDLVDPTLRETRGVSRTGTAIDKVQSSIPFLSQNLPARRGRWGQEVQAQPDYWWGSNRPKVDPVDEYLYKIGAKIEQPRNAVEIVEPTTGERRNVKLTAEEYTSMISQIPPQAKDAVRMLMQNEKFRSLPESMQAEEIKRMVIKFASIGKKTTQAQKQVQAIPMR